MFYGRQEEIKEIESFLDGDKQANIMIYGRRRIGKSYLIREALKKYKDKKIINYQCQRTTLSDFLNDFSKKLSQVFNMPYLNFTDINDLLDFVFSQNDVILVLDEYSYLQNIVTGLDSIIQAKIDNYRYEGSNLKFIACGSNISLMIKMLEYSSPLFGRFDLVLNLKEQDYYESSMFYQGFSNEDKVKMYSVFGGNSYLNSMVDDQISVEENIIRLACSDISNLSEYVKFVISPEVTKIENANPLLRSIAGGKHKFSDIQTTIGIDATPLNNVLKKLIELEVIEKVTPINDQNNRKKTFYYIKDKAIKFYYTYIFPNINFFDYNDKKVFYDQVISDNFNSNYVSLVFEDIAKQYLIKQNKLGLIKPNFTNIGRYWFDDKETKSSGEYDVVTIDKNGYIFYEVKFINKVIDETILHEEEYSLNKNNIAYYKLGFISKLGSSLDKSKYNLISLDDIYK